ncbi:fumarylacetoacetase [Ideonella dechloratans]|uniref:fumarylacetoacetase n=1 Tax=Ideonella dechloratans TaxID=36863 RepID=A0A643FEA6_IDEDE|nr:fumarylacetoacetase [Ideonella dechloratans]KAB0583967.1 fumarylacetoacetase [Ideonella dechloratans]UFU12548.1 fumarylacetoacetase [Ideonella dechloratans]
MSAYPTDSTHAPDALSWVASANAPDSDFPLQNLPYGRWRRPGETAWHLGVAIGDQVLDLAEAGLLAHADMNRLMAAPLAERRGLRLALFEGLRECSPQQAAWARALHPVAGLELGVPCEIGDYTDFYASIHHATTVGRQFRPEQPLLPNYSWVPIGYHGRASSIVASGQPVRRPVGQTRPPEGQSQPRFGPSARLDYELELGLFVGSPNALGEAVDLAQAETHLFGVTLFNDWSARDLQAWEYQPLGPFLAKNFASTVSPWVVTLEALAPFRAPLQRPDNQPAPLPYLSSADNQQQGALDIVLEVWLQTAAMRAAGHAGDRLSTSNAADAFWTPAQLLTHHTVNGCNLRSGDLLGTGTLSGPAPEQGGSLLELSAGGKQPLQLSNGEQRSFLEDGDTVILRGFCQRPGWRRIGLGECRGTVLPARTPR